MIFTNYLKKLWHAAADENNNNVAKLLEKDIKARVLDLGCDEGTLVTKRIEKYIGTSDIWGIDIDKTALIKAKSKGVKVFYGDLNNSLGFKSNFFDVVEANQVIEHLWNTDVFLAEIFRVLKPGGYLVLATENLSSWHNLFSLALGFQAPSQDVSNKFRPANPFSLCHIRPREWTAHQRLFTLKGLKELVELYGFKIEKVLASGYYPLPLFLARFLVRVDPYHVAFICIKARKVK